MTFLARYLRDLAADAVRAWNRFWFTPADPATLALIRLFTGALLLYTHAVWTLGLDEFFGQHSWANREAVDTLIPHDANDQPITSYAWSYFWWIDSLTPPWSARVLWLAHAAALVVFASLALGFFSRSAALLAYLAAVSYIHRVRPTEFGLDQVNCMLAMYLWIGPCGGAWSLDRLWAAWWHRRRTGQPLPEAAPSVGANLAIRLLQLHLCVVYLFSALGKLQGVTWWSGQALWYVLANPEYHAFDIEWLARWPVLAALLTQIVLYWELFFCTLIWWPRLRPLVLAAAVPLHLGIAFGLRILPFGLGMLIACLAFVSPALIRRMLKR
ncbi:MAG TPA: HTTM domain-containing protein [Pirellulales bacterium]|nr:HTTM domain-containing protein [Pirellulales bacterium]